MSSNGDMQALLQELNDLMRKQNDLLKLNNTLQLMSGQGLPRSKYWQWFQVTAAQAGGSITTAVKAKQSVDIVIDDKLPSSHGFLGSWDFQCDSGLFQIIINYHSGDKPASWGNTLQNLWNNDFSPRVPASAGDVIVVNQAIDEPAASGLTNWNLRSSPSWNFPFNKPFKITVTNTDTVLRNIIGFDFYFLLLRREFEKLINDAEEMDLIYGKEIQGPS